MQKGISDLIKDAGFSPREFAALLKSEEIPFQYNKQNWYNLRHGLIRPKDPFMYLWLSEKLNVDVSTIINRYSDHVRGVHKTGPNIVEKLVKQPKESTTKPKDDFDFIP